MPVDVTPLNVLGGGVQPVTRFSDTFNRGAGALGPDWINAVTIRLPFVNGNNGMANAVIAIAPDVSPAWDANYSGTAIQNYIAPMVCVCTPIMRTVYGKTQFSQWTFLAELNPANGNNAGPAVLIDWQPPGALVTNTPTYYVLNFGNNASPILARVVGSNFVSLVNPVGGGAPANGDIYRLTATPAAGNTVLTVVKNGVLQNTFNDGVNSLVNGSPGASVFGMTTNGQIFMRNFVGGIGLQ